MNKVSYVFFLFSQQKNTSIDNKKKCSHPKTTYNLNIDAAAVGNIKEYPQTL